jgi:spore germination cell wall hydrolase CwlJ-like protein
MKYIITTIVAVLLLTFSSIQAHAEKLIELYDAKTYPQHYCLALNIYFEARGSTLADQAGVANVVINRTNDRRYPDTICGVVHQGNKDAKGNMKRNECQFSWYCDGKDDIPSNVNVWVESQMLAWQMIEDSKYRGLTEGATHYHATYVHPSWAKSLQLVGRIGEHIFYRWEN